MHKVLLHFMEKQEEKQGGKYRWLRLSTHPTLSQSRDLENCQDEAFGWNSFHWNLVWVWQDLNQGVELFSPSTLAYLNRRQNPILSPFPSPCFH